MNNKRLLTLILALLVIAISWWRVMTVQMPLRVTQMVSYGVPLLYIVSENVKNVPGVLIAHGYAGSKQLMLGYAYTWEQRDFLKSDKKRAMPSLRDAPRSKIPVGVRRATPTLNRESSTLIK